MAESTLDKAEISRICKERLRGLYDIRYILARARHEDASAVDVFVAVSGSAPLRARWRCSGYVIDAFVGYDEYISTEIDRGLHRHLLDVVAEGILIEGDASSAAALVREARSLLRKAVEPPSAAEVFRFRCQPFDLLRAFSQMAGSDATAAGIVLSTLVQTIVDGFFVVNRVRRPRVNDTLRSIAQIRPDVAELLATVLRTPISKLQSEPAPLLLLVSRVFGEERVESTLTERQPRQKSRPNIICLQPPSLHDRAQPSGMKSKSREALLAYGRQSDVGKRPMEKR